MAEPKVTLVNYTPNAIATMAYFRRIMHSGVPDTLEELIDDPEKWLEMSLDEYFNTVLLHDGMPTFLEGILLLFKIENVSRSCTHQIVRNRVGFSYSQQSMRCIKAENFADDVHFTISKTIKNKKGYIERMKKIQEVYRQSLADGESTQDSRGLLPTEIQTSILISATLRAIIGMINKRMCNKTQGEFKEIAVQMRDQIVEKIDSKFIKYFGTPCEIQGYCMMGSENETQFKEGKLTGEQNTDHVCSRYIKLLKNEAVG